LTGGLISSTGTVTGSSLLGSVVSVTANVTGGNILTGGIISATGNVAGNFFIGNGSALTGIDATGIQSGTSNVKVVSSGGNATISIGGTSNVAVFATTGAFITGVTSASGNVTGGNLLTGGLISSTGTITGTSHLGSVVSVTGNVTGGNILTSGLLSLGGSSQAASYSASGNITGGNLTVSTGTVTVGNIVNANGNGVGNIGSTSLYFNTIFGKATTAQYADLAEVYAADADYTPGTVLVFGGDREVTISTTDSSRRVAGVVSTNPAHLMNATLESEHKVSVALTGRVPTRVIGPIAKGDMMVSTGDGRARAEAEPLSGAVIGKALEDFDGAEGTIEIVVGRI